MANLFRQIGEIYSKSELLDALKLQGCLVPSLIYLPVKWEYLYGEVVEVVECIDFLWKDDVVSTRWGDEFDSLDKEQSPYKTRPIVSICGMI